ncbi:MAG: hypothetical protein ACFFCS_10330 [Candidatus Hodarchaeota archaeon]
MKEERNLLPLDLKRKKNRRTSFAFTMSYLTFVFGFGMLDKGFDVALSPIPTNVYSIIKNTIEISEFIIFLACFYFLVRVYLKSRHKHLLILLLFYITLALYSFMIMTNELIHYVVETHVFAVISGFPGLVFINSISRDSVQPGQLAMYSAFAGMYFVTTGQLQYNFYLICIALLIGAFMYYFLWIYLESPPRLKRSTRITFLGTVLFASMVVLNALGVKYIIPAADTLISLVYFVLIGYITIKHPQILYLLPFRAHRLTVIETEGGISLFDHFWRTDVEMKQDGLFSSMLQGIGAILKESVNQGEIQSIRFDRATMLIKRMEGIPCASVLVTTKTSKALEKSLEEFSRRFQDLFAGRISRPHETTQFEPAKELVEECFPFIPEA